MWHLHCDNPQALKACFADDLVGNPVVMRQVDVNYDASTLRLRFDLPDRPQRLNPRWPEGANTIQVHFLIEAISGLNLSGWSRQVPCGPLTLERVGNHLRFTFTSPQVQLSGECECARIESLAGYIDSTREELCPDCSECPHQEKKNG